MECDDSNNFCTNCGCALGKPHEPNFQNADGNGQYPPPNGQYAQNGFDPQRPYMYIQPRNIAVCIILTIITCGIYGIWWMVKLNDEINFMSGEPGATSGVAVWLLSIVTCGIYGLYWYYRMGERCDRIKNNPYGNSGLLYLVIGLFGFGIVNYCLMQDTINRSGY